MASPGSADNPRKRGRTTRASGTGARPLVHQPLFAPGIAVSAAPLFPVQAAAAAPQPAPRPRTPEASNQAQPRWLARNANAARAQTVLGPDGGVSGCVGDLCDRLLASLASSASESSVDDKVRLKCAEVRQAAVAGTACAAGKVSSGGVVAGMLSNYIGLPPIEKYGSHELKSKVLPACMSGDDIGALAITEPSG